MEKESILIKVQKKFGIARYELVAIFLIASGLLFGAGYKIILGGEDLSGQQSGHILYLLDSLAKAEQTSFVGSDSEGKPNAELASGDTIIKKESPFPAYSKKELPNEKINLNSSSKAELMRIPGIGDKTADAIIEYRKSRKFASIEEIKNIKGIGEKKFLKMKDYIRVN